MNIEEYIASGILESYVLGSATEAETRELLYLKNKYPAVQHALEEVEMIMERVADHMAVPPPPQLWEMIESEINALTLTDSEPVSFKEPFTTTGHSRTQENPLYIEADVQSPYMRVHKAWKWALITFFVLGKIFLACAIYFYLENRQAQQQLNELKTELRQLQHK